MQRRTLEVLGVVLLCVPASGYTSCTYFSSVVVPATDGVRPMMAARVFIDGVETTRVGTITQSVDDPDAIIVAVSAAIDAGGVRSLTMTRRVEVRCHDAGAEPELGQLTVVSFTPLRDTQSGTVGSTVSNGLYLVDAFRLSDYTNLCAPGFDLVRVTYLWSMTARDFHGNTASLPESVIVYRRPGS
jgi:hypothetical protein